MDSLNTFNTEELYEALKVILQTNVTPFIKGSPSTAKSSVVKQYAEDNNLELIDVRLAQYDVLDIGGMVKVAEDGKSFSHIPLDVFPTIHTKVPKGKSGWLLFLDELLLAPPSVQNGAYKLILDRMVGQYPLHKKCRVVAASNLITDNASVIRENTALRSRMVHLRAKNIEIDDWRKWAIQNDIDYRILGFLEHDPSFMDQFDPDSESDTYPCARTWEFASDILKKKPKNDVIVPLLSGTVGANAAVTFNTYLEHYADLPTFDDILNKPGKAKLVNAPGAIFAVISFIISRIKKKKQLKPIMEYMSRIEVEYQTLFVRSLLLKNTSYLTSSAIKKWRKSNREFLI